MNPLSIVICYLEEISRLRCCNRNLGIKKTRLSSDGPQLVCLWESDGEMSFTGTEDTGALE